jgi:hypothetical protein
MVVFKKEKKNIANRLLQYFCCYALEHFGLHNESLKVHEAVDKAIELNRHT